MSDLERRIEHLFATDSRATQVQGVRMARRGSAWPSAAFFVAAAAAMTIGAVVLLQTVRTQPSDVAAPSVVAPPSATPAGTPASSADGKSIVVDGRPVLSVDDQRIVQWFRAESQLCDERNIGTTPDRGMFCTDVAAFRDAARFASVVSSPDGTKVGFTIQTDTLSPDEVVGILVRPTNSVRFLTDYYLGNAFIGFSPNGTHFVYRASCFEGKCGLVVRDSESLKVKAELNISDGMDRSETAEFVRWTSENEIEYRLGDELKRVSF